MKSKLAYLSTCIFILFSLTQCNSPTSDNKNEEVEKFPKPELVAPANNAENQSETVDLSWKRIKGAKEYDIQIATNQEFDSTLIDERINGTSFTTPSLSLGSKYYWKVKPYKKNWTGPWSDIWSFSTAEQEQDPVKVELNAPNDGAEVSVNKAFDWSSVSQSASYHYQLSRSSSFSDVVKDSVIQSSQVEVSALQEQTQYYWRVIPVLDSAPTTWSNVRDFTTQSVQDNIPAVTLVAPADGATDQSTTLTLEWENLADITEYQIQVASDSSFSSPVVDQTTGNISYDVSDLNYSQTYYWRVQASGDDDNENWSTIREFETEQESTNPTPTNNGAIISAENGDFVADGDVFRFVGSNAYHLPSYEQIDPSLVDETLDTYQEAGVTVIRTWGFYDGPPQYDNDISLQPEPGVYNEADLKHLDNLIAKAKEHNIRVILTLVNYWDALGGISQYNEWDGNGGGGMSHFINDPDTQQWFKDYISMLTNRVNTVTGVAYKNEPAIFSWEIINEGRLPDGDPQELRDWYQDIAQHIKSEDPNHMVSTGEEGFEENTPSEYSEDQYSNTYVLRANMGSSYVMNTAIREIDYGTAHWYPENWGLSATEFSAQHAWLSDHAKIAEDLGKPFVMGEWGDDNGWGDSDQEAMYNDFYSHAEQIQLDGSLLWQFTPTSTKCYEFGGNICWPGGRQDETLYNSFIDHIQAITSSN